MQPTCFGTAISPTGRRKALKAFSVRNASMERAKTPQSQAPQADEEIYVRFSELSFSQLHHAEKGIIGFTPKDVLGF